jgi:cytochrome c553
MKKIAFLFSFLVAAAISSGNMVAQGDPSAGQAKSAVCGSCHGADGNSPLAMNPKLAGQGEAYLYKQLVEFKSGARQNATMAAMVMALNDEDMHDLAAYYSSQEVTLGGAAPELVDLGRSLYRAGNKDLGVAACMACHAPDGLGNGPAGFPALGGQHAEYTLTQLKSFRSGTRNNDAAKMMRTTVERLTDPELEALASYLAGLN